MAARSLVFERIVVFAPPSTDDVTGTDGHEGFVKPLLDAGFTVEVVADAALACDMLVQGAGALLLTDGVFSSVGRDSLVETLRAQPPWSDVPILLITEPRPESPVADWAIAALGNVVVLERPVPDGSLRRAIQAALHSRRRQYEYRDQLPPVGQKEAHFRLLADAIPSIVWTAAPDGTLTFANRRWLEYSGQPPEASLTAPSELLHPDDRDRALASWRQALGSGEPFEIEVRRRRHDGVYRWFVARAEPLRDADGHIVAWFGMTTDIHDQKELQERLRQSDVRNSELLATLAHELRNPLAPIRNSLHILRLAGHDPANREKAIAMIDRQVKQLVHYVDDLLDVSRLDRGRIQLRRERVNLTDVVRVALETAQPEIDARRHMLSVSMPPEPAIVDGDPVRLVQVIANLLDNAAKYTAPGGEIALSARRERDAVIVAVRDGGLGIAPERLANIFDMFGQATPASGRSHGSLGIGLSVVRSLVQMHGGSVEARSEGLGHGSEFIVRLPLAGSGTDLTSVTESRALTDAVSAGAAHRILVVDDNEDSARSLGTILRLLGHDVHLAHDGSAALEVARALKPDIVVMDIGMPGSDGYQVAQLLRKEGDFAQTTLIALTGFGQSEDRVRAIEAGFDDHLVKPADFDSLRQALASRRQR
jgi:PAS domain S-box-containing protein